MRIGRHCSAGFQPVMMMAVWRETPCLEGARFRKKVRGSEKLTSK